MTGQRAIEGNIRSNAAADEAKLGEDAPLKLEHFLPYQLNVVSSLVSQALSQVYSRRYAIGVPEWRVVVTLGQHGVMTAKAIGAHTHMHKTKVSRAVALLEKRRLTTRRANRDDMRESLSVAHRRRPGHVRRGRAACTRLRPAADGNSDAERPRSVQPRHKAINRTFGGARGRVRPRPPRRR